MLRKARDLDAGIKGTTFIQASKQERSQPPWTNYNHSHELRYRGKKRGEITGT